MSEPDAIEETVAGIIADVLGIDAAEIERDAPLATLGWDSMNSIEALVRLERNLSVDLDLRSFHAAHTIAQMAALVEKLRAGGPSHA